mmetsp:Transcript_8442/g.16348  ORF Transcript_8442/g.16348 Transcript_8442/m.16348 type:complete len:201 (+) Transcript_8442:147-749(+)
MKKTLIYPKLEDANLIYDYALLINIGNQMKLAFEKLNEIRLFLVKKNQDTATFFNILKTYKNKEISKTNQQYNMFCDRSYMEYFLNDSKINKIWKYLFKIIKLYHSIKNNIFKKIFLYSPNLSSLVGEQIAVQLVFKTYGLINLVKLPASSLSNLSFGVIYNIYEKNTISAKQKIIKHSYLVSQSNASNRYKIILQYVAG